jgi:hypothetical protein
MVASIFGEREEMRGAQRHRDQGIFLIEAVAGVLILVSAMITMTVVFHGSVNYFNKVEKVNQASLIARSEIVQLRSQALTPSEFQLLLSGVNSTRTVDGFQVVTQVETHPLDSPCSTLELPFGADARRLDSSAVKATVSVKWEGSNAAIEPVFETIICEPAREPATVEIAAVGPLQFEAVLKDSGGIIIEDVGFEWVVADGPGQGRFLPVDRLARQAVFQQTAPGAVTIEASTYYLGVKSKDTINVP